MLGREVDVEELAIAEESQKEAGALGKGKPSQR